jgi:hypothetical protein
MKFQGMKSAKKICDGKSTSPKRRKTADSPVQKPDSPEDSARSELMKSVRQKIKTGYYNSESVLDDLSHGFASAVNSI